MTFRSLTLSALTVGALAVAGCGSDDSSSTSTAAPAASAPATSTAAPATQGTLTVAADATYAPNEFVGDDGKTVMGADVDLAKALGTQLKFDVTVKNATFDSIIPGLAANKYDLGMSSFTDTKEREKTVDFVTYLTAGTSFYTKASGGTDVSGLADLCGKKVAVEKGTTQADDVTAQNKKCGSKKITLLTFPDQNGANLAITSGRAQIGMADSPIADYQVKKSGGQFKSVGTAYGEAPYGIAIPKGGKVTPDQVLAGMKALIASGEYTKILTKWGIQAGAITDPKINGATS